MDVAAKQWAQTITDQIVTKVLFEMKRLNGATPYIPFDGQYIDVVAERGIDWWTNGFWSGLLWQLKFVTGNTAFSDTAIEQEQRLDQALYEYRDVHHDVGFMWLLSSVAHYRQTGNQQSLRTGLHAADLLAGRFNSAGNYLVAWNDHKPGWTIIDSMMNIQLLFWASAETKDPRFALVAEKHAQTIAKYLVRSDGSVGHIASFEPGDGKFIEQIAGQGFSADSAWSRGNAWAIYGFALTYAHTKNPYYLKIAKQVANFFLSSVAQTDYIPVIDFKAPKDPIVHDSSAGVCAACGLLEIAKWVTPEERALYEQKALTILKATESRYGNWDPQQDGIIYGGAEAYHRPATYSVSLIYSDYFFTEAILRVQGRDFSIW